jgi:hypothetical protein
MSQRVNSVLFERDETRLQQINRTVVDSGIDITGFFGFYILGGSQIQEQRNDFNTTYLSSGAFKGATLKNLYSTFVGTGQSIITTPVIIKVFSRPPKTFLLGSHRGRSKSIFYQLYVRQTLETRVKGSRGRNPCKQLLRRSTGGRSGANGKLYGL